MQHSEPRPFTSLSHTDTAQKPDHTYWYIMMNDDPFSLDDLGSPPPVSGPDPAHTLEPPYFKGLNAPQRAAVLATEGPVLVLAGAGTGKTRVLTTRIAHIINRGLSSPWNMLAVTFTNKAAREMQNRIAHTLGRPIEGMWIGTFHSLCVRILRRHAELAGLKSNFTILDTDDQIRLLKQLIQAEQIDDKKWPARQLATLIDRWKNAALSPANVSGEDAYSFANGKAKALYTLYQERLKTLNAADFGDLLLHTIHIFQNNPDVLKDYHRQFKYLLVDEYQDTNVAQYLWLRLLAQGNKNVCCVGDDDQSIYGWRGAEVGNILKFEADFPGAEVIRLEQNYRSSGHILAAASGLINANEGRLGKTLWTEAGYGEAVSIRGVWDAREEARSVCEQMESQIATGHNPQEIAILVRAGFQTREFEERLINLGMPYRVIGGPRFYERAEIRDAMAYLRVLAQGDDDLAFERIINVPKRGVGSTSVQKIHTYARTHAVSMTMAARDICSTNEIRGKARSSITKLLDDFDRWRGLLSAYSHVEMAEMILDESGYTDMWRSDTAPDAAGRLENLKELVSAMEDFESLGGFLEHIALVMENDDKDETKKVSLMTLHAAKGLEFDTVYLPGWEEGIFPNQRALDDSGQRGLEEERRLAYVGLTRARKRARIYFAANRQIFGQWQSSIPSRFIEELPEDHIDVETDTGLTSGRSGRFDYAADDEVYMTTSGMAYGGGYGRGSHYGNGKSYSGRRRDAYDQTEQDDDYVSPFALGPQARRFPTGRTIEGEIANRPSSPPRAKHKATRRTTELTCSYAIGERVFHQKFGYGIIEDIEGNKVEVAFDKAGTKRILDQFLMSAEEAEKL